MYMLITAVSSEYVYEFPRAAMTEYCKLGGLKQQEFVFTQP